MNLLDVLRPAHAAGEIVLAVLAGMVAVWFAVLFGSIRATLLERRCLSALDRSVDESPKALSADELRRRWGRRVVVGPLGQMLGLSRMEAEAASQRVAVSAERQLFRAFPFLQALLNLFVVVGLLGTLFGLAESLSSLRAEDREQFGRLLTGLRSAFAPSIWGVSASIVCGLLLAAYRAALLEPLLVELRSKTDKWLDILTIPVEAEVVNAAQTTINAAKDVVRFAEEIRGDSARLKGAVQGTIESFRLLQDCSKAVEQSLVRGSAAISKGAQLVASASNSLAEGVDRCQRLWADAEERRADVQGMLARSLDTSTRVEATIAEWKKSAVASHERLDVALKQQSTTLEKVGKDVERAAHALETSAGNVADRAATIVKEELSGRAAALEKTLTNLDDHVSTLRKPFEDAAGRLVSVGNALMPTANRLEGQAMRLGEIADRRVRSGDNSASDMTGVEMLLGQLLAEIRRNPVRRLFRFRQ